MVSRPWYATRRPDLSGWLGTQVRALIRVIRAGYMIYSLGAGTNAPPKSFLSSAIDREHITSLYTVMTAIETLDGLLGMPFQATAYS